MSKKPLSVDTSSLWQKRLGKHLSESIYYLGLVASSGGLFASIILFILALMYYEAFISLIPVNTPLPLLFSLILAAVITRVRFRTLLLEADLLFLTPIETKMETYFKRASRYNLAVQIFHVGIILIALTPIYTHLIPVEHQNLLLYFLIPFLLKGWNMHSAWAGLRVQDERKVFVHTLTRFVFNFLLLYIFFSGGKIGSFPLWLIALPLLAIVLVWLYVQEKRWQAEHLLNWFLLLEMENSLKNRFYQFVNAFTDVPQLQSKVRKRAWLNFLTVWIPFQAQQSYKYLYLKTFIRANEYLGLYFRLCIVGLLIVNFLPDMYSKGIAYILFLWIANTQLKAMWGHHARQFWISLYPLPKQLQKDAFTWLLSVLLGAQAIIMLIPAFWQLHALPVNGFMLVLGLGFAYGYPQLILKRKLSSN